MELQEFSWGLAGGISERGRNGPCKREKSEPEGWRCHVGVFGDLQDSRALETSLL